MRGYRHRFFDPSMLHRNMQSYLCGMSFSCLVLGVTLHTTMFAKDATRWRPSQVGWRPSLLITTIFFICRPLNMGCGTRFFNTTCERREVSRRLSVVSKDGDPPSSGCNQKPQQKRNQEAKYTNSLYARKEEQCARTSKIVPNK